jgi:hypothetical protein
MSCLAALLRFGEEIIMGKDTAVGPRLPDISHGVENWTRLAEFTDIADIRIISHPVIMCHYRTRGYRLYRYHKLVNVK